MFNFPRKPIPQQQPTQRTSEGCQIKVSRDKNGNIRSVTTNGKCNRAELDIFRQNLENMESEEETD